MKFILDRASESINTNSVLVNEVHRVAISANKRLDIAKLAIHPDPEIKHLGLADHV